MKAISRAVGLLTLLCVLLVPANIFSCGNWIETTFVLKHQPSWPLQSFDAGKLGILWPGFERRYLVIAYRYLEQKPLTADERKSLDDAVGPHLVPADVPSDPDAPVTAWLKARSHALGLPAVAQIDIWRYRRHGFTQYPNCGDDAFFNAAQTATSRAQTFGVGAAAMREWVAGQDAVFQNCGSAEDLKYYPSDQKPPPAAVHLPPPVTLNDAVLKFDRQYQLAAANFYAGELDTTIRELEQISQEPGSPWRQLAPYLVARCYIRQATIGPTGDKPFLPEPMHLAEERLKAILADPSLATMHPAALRLLNYVEARLHPEQRMHAIALQLTSGAADNFTQDLFDYTFLLDHVLQDLANNTDVQQRIHAYRGQVDSNEVGDAMAVNVWREDADKSGSLDDLTDWVLTFQVDRALTSQYRLERWQATKSMPWVLSALVSIHAGDAHFAEVERAATTIAPDSPAHDTALYQRARLLREENKNEQVRKLLDENWARIEKDSPSDRNAFLAQRFAVATSFQEFLRFAPRTPVELDDKVGKLSFVCQSSNCTTTKGEVIDPPPPRLEADSVKIFNQQLPLNMLVQAANRSTLPEDLRDELAVRMWLRAAILDDRTATQALEPHIRSKYPEMRSYLDAYDQADSTQSRRFALVFMVMHFAGMQPFVNPGALGSVTTPGIVSYSSWWCYDVGGDLVQRPVESAMYSDPTPPAKIAPNLPPPPPWLTTAENQRAREEWHKLSGIGPAPLYFAPVVLGWAKDHPDDPRVPEALYYFVRATRYGCVDKSIGRYSRQAFDMLHRKYPASEWTKKTPYWFG